MDRGEFHWGFRLAPRVKGRWLQMWRQGGAEVRSAARTVQEPVDAVEEAAVGEVVEAVEVLCILHCLDMMIKLYNK